MTYKTFKYEVRKLGLNFYILNDLISVQDSKGNALYSVDTVKLYIVYHTKRFLELDDAMQKKVFDLVYLLARTPIENRGDLYHEGKWYLRHKYLNTRGNDYLQKDPYTSDLSLGKKESLLAKCKFTNPEIKALANRININEFEKEEVE